MARTSPHHPHGPPHSRPRESFDELFDYSSSNTPACHSVACSRPSSSPSSSSSNFSSLTSSTATSSSSSLHPFRNSKSQPSEDPPSLFLSPALPSEGASSPHGSDRHLRGLARASTSHSLHTSSPRASKSVGPRADVELHAHCASSSSSPNLKGPHSKICESPCQHISSSRSSTPRALREEVELKALEGKLQLLTIQRQLSAVKCQQFVDELESSLSSCSSSTSPREWRSRSGNSRDSPEVEERSRMDGGTESDWLSSVSRRARPQHAAAAAARRHSLKVRRRSSFDVPSSRSRCPLPQTNLFLSYSSSPASSSREAWEEYDSRHDPSHTDRRHHRPHHQDQRHGDPPHQLRHSHSLHLGRSLDHSHRTQHDHRLQHYHRHHLHPHHTVHGGSSTEYSDLFKSEGLSANSHSLESNTAHPHFLPPDSHSLRSTPPGGAPPTQSSQSNPRDHLLPKQEGEPVGFLEPETNHKHSEEAGDDNAHGWVGGFPYRNLWSAADWTLGCCCSESSEKEPTVSAQA